MKRFCAIAVAILLVVLQTSCSFAENVTEMDFSPTTEKDITFNGLPWGSSRESFLETVYYLRSGSKVTVHPGDIDWSASSEEIFAQLYYLDTGNQIDYEDSFSYTEELAALFFEVYLMEVKFDDIKHLFDGSVFPTLHEFTGDFVIIDIAFYNPINVAGHGVNTISGVFYFSPNDKQYHLFSAVYDFIIDDTDDNEKAEKRDEMVKDLQHKLNVLYGEAHTAPDGNRYWNYVWIDKNEGAVYCSNRYSEIIYGDLSVSEKLQEIEIELQRERDKTLDYTGL